MEGRHEDLVTCIAHPQAACKKNRNDLVYVYVYYIANVIWIWSTWSGYMNCNFTEVYLTKVKLKWLFYLIFSQFVASWTLVYKQ